MKIGRNAPCPCGSGKKYKKCCLGKENVSDVLLWRRLGEAYDRLSKNLMNHGRQVFGIDGITEAIDEFFHKAIKDVRRKLGLDKTALSNPKLVHHNSNKVERVETIKTMLKDFGREELNPLYIGFAINLFDDE